MRQQGWDRFSLLKSEKILSSSTSLRPVKLDQYFALSPSQFAALTDCLLPTISLHVAFSKFSSAVVEDYNETTSLSREGRKEQKQVPLL